MIVTFVNHHLQVADSIVAFLVVHIEERRDLWETLCQMLQQPLGSLFILLLFIMKLHNHHPFSAVRVSDDDVSQKSTLFSQVKELDIVSQCIVSYLIAYIIVHPIHQSTLLDRQNLVEGTGDMESNSIHIIKCSPRCHLLFGKPPFVRTSKFQLVSIFLGLYTAEDRVTFRKSDLSYASQLILHLLLFRFELLLVGQVLPLASATHTEMLAEGRYAYLTIFNESHHLSLAITVFFLLHLQVNNIPWHGKRHKNHHVVHASQSLTFGSHISDCHPF